MKKLVWLAMGVGLAVTAYGQGQVNMNSSSASAVLRFSNTVTRALCGAATDQAGTAYHVALYWGASATDLVGPAGNIAGTLAWVGSSATAGQVLSSTGGGARTINDSPGVPRLALTYFQLRAWTGASQTYEQALTDPTALVSVITAGQAGFSPIVSAIPQQSSTAGIPAVPWGGTAAAPLFVSMIPVPEPSTLALAGLGLMGLILIRRRK